MSQRADISHSADEFDSFSSNYSKYDLSKKSNLDVTCVPDQEINYLNFDGSQVHESIKRINNLIGQGEKLNREINEKVQELRQVNEDVEAGLKSIKNLSLPNAETIRLPYLPTPTDENDLDKSVQMRSWNGEQLYGNDHDIPSSPEILSIEGSDIDEAQIEINDRISRMVAANYNDENIMKLKNIVNSSFDLLKFEKNGNGAQLMNVNDEVRHKSELLIDKLYSLVESFT